MKQPDTPLLVVVTGPPGGGKTTIARELSRRLGLPLFAKDDVKETLFDVLGTGDRSWSRQLGAVAFELLFLIASRELAAGRSLILEANFARGQAEHKFESLPRHRVVQVHVSAPLEVLLERYRSRERHPGHLDGEMLAEVAGAVREDRHRPLDLPGDVLEVETSERVSLDALEAELQARLHG
jgi:predicted kinase